MIFALKCPECNGNINLESDRKFGFCQYCGTKIMIDSVKNEIDEQKMDKVSNLFDFAIVDMRLGNFKSSYELFGKVLEINSSNFKALFLRELCNYRLYHNFENLKNVYLFCLRNADGESRNFCKSEFADILVEVSDYENSTEIVNCVLGLSKTLIGCETLDLKEYFSIFKNDAETFLKVNKWKIRSSERRKVSNIVNEYKKILSSINT